jgi:dephospho-CoA kinase
VRARAAAITAAAPADAVVVQDIPLLVETGQGAAFHLVVVVDAGDDVRLQRMLEHRGMGAEAARARMAAQATRGDRLAAADVVLDNSGTLQELLDQVDRLWAGRLVPFAAHLSDGTPAPRRGGPVLEPYREDWAREAQRIMSRLRHAVAGSGMPGADKITLEHVGSTSVPGLAAKDVLDLQLAVPDLGVADALDPVLAAAGFPRVAHITSDSPMPATPEPGEWAKRFHANADPGRAVNLHVRATGSAGWRYALMFRDWLRAEPDAAADYLALKRRLAAAHAGDATTGAYAEAKEDWFSGASEPLERWAGRTAWQPPSYAP